jgi:uncharacterized protein YbbC (DUF1343 family)/CubicO group peptidase (beta-lactamase class C family)
MLTKLQNILSSVRTAGTFFALTAFLLTGTAGAAPILAYARVSPKSDGALRKQQLSPISDLVKKEVREGRIPGAVVLVGDREKVFYRRAFGFRELTPQRLPMTLDTIFDIASLTKVVATTTAIMQLAQEGKLSIDAPAATYWPEFGVNGKSLITVKELLTHYSGLRPDLSLDRPWEGYETALAMIIDEQPVCPPGTRFIYSDINFEVLGELVHRISGLDIAEYSKKYIFSPLGMKDTLFSPPQSLWGRIASTQEGGKTQRKCGAVHDPSCYRMGGVAGHAGLFSTADDLAVFARMLLGNGVYRGKEILSPSMVKTMTSPQSPPGNEALRGLGWQLGPAFASNNDELPPFGSYGHTGYTGTEIRIDPVTGTYVIILTNRVHIKGKGDAKRIRRGIRELISRSIGPISPERVRSHSPSLTAGQDQPSVDHRRVRTGIDVLYEENFSALAGLRVGLITNHSGVDSSGHRTADLLYNAPNLKLVALFSPEHGLAGNSEGRVLSSTEPVTGLPVYSLYGDVREPTDQMLDGVDALVFDVQDAGVRFYTYISTMGRAMEAAAKRGISFYVLDRPNPLTAAVIQGPVLDTDLKSFTGYFPLPVRHGMTVGELARMFNEENRIGVDLHIIRMRGYRRTDWFDQTGLDWVAPSPNLRSLTEAVLYPGTALIEGANVSVGRGTATPFELIGATWINAERLATFLSKRDIRGVRVVPENFTPEGSNFAHKPCHGIRIILKDRDALDPVRLGLELASALYRLYPNQFRLDSILGSVGSKAVLDEIKKGTRPHDIALNWQNRLEEFTSLRSKYLLY